MKSLLSTGKLFQWAVCSQLVSYLSEQSALNWWAISMSSVLSTGELSQWAVCSQLVSYLSKQCALNWWAISISSVLSTGELSQWQQSHTTEVTEPINLSPISFNKANSVGFFKLLSALVDGDLAFMVLLDLSAAFWLHRPWCIVTFPAATVIAGLLTTTGGLHYYGVHKNGIEEGSTGTPA